MPCQPSAGSPGLLVVVEAAVGVVVQAVVLDHGLLLLRKNGTNPRARGR